MLIIVLVLIIANIYCMLTVCQGLCGMHYIFYCICSTEHDIGISPFNRWRSLDFNGTRCTAKYKLSRSLHAVGLPLRWTLGHFALLPVSPSLPDHLSHPPPDLVPSQKHRRRSLSLLVTHFLLQIANFLVPVPLAYCISPWCCVQLELSACQETFSRGEREGEKYSICVLPVV